MFIGLFLVQLAIGSFAGFLGGTLFPKLTLGRPGNVAAGLAGGYLLPMLSQFGYNRAYS